MELSARQDATQVLNAVVHDLLSGNCDLKVCLRACQHACQLLDWQPQRDWFQRELDGYLDDAQLPSYRTVQGMLVWSAADVLDQITWSVASESKAQQFQQQLTSLDVRSPMDWLLLAAKNGFSDAIGEAKQVYLRYAEKQVAVRQTRVFAPASFGIVISRIEQWTYSFASVAYVQLRYSEVLTDVWTGFSSRVDKAIQTLGLSDNLEAIRSGLRSDNAQEWRNAVFGCRNLLNDLANHLWQDPRPTYDLLNGKGPGGKLEVQKGKFANRLSAYLHQKSISGTRRQFLQSQFYYLSESIRSLISFQSEAHEPMAREDANAIAVATYFIIGELALRTDLQPVKEYVHP